VFGGLILKGDSEYIYGFTPPPQCEVILQCPNPPGDAADGLAGVCIFEPGPGADHQFFVYMLGYSGTIYQINLDSCVFTEVCELPSGLESNGLGGDGVRFWFDSDSGDLGMVTLDCYPTATTSWTWGRVKSSFR